MTDILKITEETIVIVTDEGYKVVEIDPGACKAVIEEECEVVVSKTEFRIIEVGVSATPGISLTEIEKTYNCEASAAVQDIVYLSLTEDNKVIVNTNNQILQPSIGVIKEKVSATVCKVLLLGISGHIWTGVEQGKKIFLSTSGTTTHTPPTTGYVQELGIGTLDEQFYVNPNYRRIERYPGYPF